MQLNLLAVLLMLSLVTFSQNEFKSGFVVGIKGDTVNGFLKEDTEESLTRGVFFKNEQGTIQLLNESQIHSFGFINGSLFRLVKYTDVLDSNHFKTHFAKCLFEGTFDLFSFRRGKNRFFVVNTSSDLYYFLFDDIKSPNGELVEKGNFRNQLLFLGYSCESMRAKVETIIYSEKEIHNFFSGLEKCSGNLTTSHSFYRKPAMQRRVFLYGAGMAVSDRYDITGQVIVRFILPSESKKTSLNTGVAYQRSFLKEDYTGYSGVPFTYDHFTDIISISLAIQHNFTRGIIQPYIYAGPGLAFVSESEVVSIATQEIGFNQRFGATFVLGIGVEGILAKNWIIKADWRYELLFHLPVVGIAYRFH